MSSSSPSFRVRLFFSPHESRLRAGWRLAGHFVLLLSLYLLFGVAISGWVDFTSITLEKLLLLRVAVEFPAVTLSVYLARRWFDRRSFVSLGLQWRGQAVRELGFGFALAGLMMGLIFLLEWAMGWMQFQGYFWEEASALRMVQPTLIAFALFVLVGWQEELICRGYYLQNLVEGLNLPWGLAISSAFFALAHLLNPHFSLMALVGLFASGILLAYGYLRTRRLWLPIGLHIGWNFFEGTVFGFPVSGMDFFTLIQQKVNGPQIFTGGTFGPEAGLILIPSLLLGVVLIYRYTRK